MSCKQESGVEIQKFQPNLNFFGSYFLSVSNYAEVATNT